MFSFETNFFRVLSQYLFMYISYNDYFILTLLAGTKEINARACGEMIQYLGIIHMLMLRSLSRRYGLLAELSKWVKNP